MQNSSLKTSLDVGLNFEHQFRLDMKLVEYSVDPVQCNDCVYTCALPNFWPHPDIMKYMWVILKCQKV